MRVGIIDSDLIGRKKHRFPNLALMKISGYMKSLGDDVSLITSYSELDNRNYDRLFLSKVFTDTFIPDRIMMFDNLEYGGTGFFLDKATPLEDHIEHFKPDYDLYRSWALSQISIGNPKEQYKYYLNTSIGFTTRGCFRKCEFCVNKNYTKVIAHSPIEEFYDERNNYICLLDDNIMGYPKAKDIWEKLESLNKNFEYKQGMDFRILTDEKMKMITSSNNYNQRAYIFAFDDYSDKDIIINQLNKYRNMTDKFTRFYVLTGFDKTGKYDSLFWEKDLIETFDRIKILMEYGCLPYLMRYEKWQDSPYRGTYSNLNRWCNYPRYFKKMSYREINLACSRWRGREKSSEVRHMELVELDFPEIAKKYFDIKWDDICRYKVK